MQIAFFDCNDEHSLTETSLTTTSAISPNISSLSSPCSFDTIRQPTTEAVAKTSKKRKRDRCVAIPRLLKNDLRRQYGVMFANAINSGDGALASLFFRRYASQSLSLSKHNSNPSIAFYLQMSGPSNVGEYWSRIMESSPDLVLRVRDVCVHTRKGVDGACRLTAQFQVRGTRVVDILPPLIAKKVCESESHIVLGNRLTEPISFTFNGEFVLWIDKEKLIEKFMIESQ